MKLFRRSLSRAAKIPNINFKNNFIFIHIPKNAGTAIRQNIGLEDSKHRTVKEYVKMLGRKRYEAMLSFAFVRNPFSRFISLYNYARLEVSHYHNNREPEKAIYGRHMDYNILRNASIEEAACLLKEGKLIHNPPHTQWNPQIFWLKDADDQFNVKYLGRMEDMELSLRNIHALLGVKPRHELQKVNTSSRKPTDYRRLIDHSTRTILEEHYKEDLETFNYDF